ncbi:MAG TPA: tetratricopeptide repeat protein [Nitrosopumilaceae archaeon]|nr:tetratricopeptide repeat protein [Nitrosopumilaceae archaeon]
MKFYGFIVLLSIMVIFSTLNQSDAQVFSNKSYSHAPFRESLYDFLAMKDKVSATLSNGTSPVESPVLSNNTLPPDSLDMKDKVSATLSNGTSPVNSPTIKSAPVNNATTPAPISQQLYKQGNALFDQGKYQDAISYYNKTLGIDPANINALYNTALALDRLNNTNDAISYYDKVLAITPNDTDSLNNKGVDLANLGKYDEAISSYDKVLAINPSDTDALYNIGIAYDNLGKHDKAILYYDNVLAIDPTNVDALNKMNLTYNNANKTTLSVVQKLDKTSLYIVVGLGIVLAVTIIIINLIAKRSKSEQKVSETSPTIKEEEESTRTKIQDEDKSADIKIQKDDDNDWSGI